MTRTAGTALLAHLDTVPAAWRGAVIAIGNFDGMHRGHQAVLEQARATARRIGSPCLVLTFEPHPRSFFRPDQSLFRLTPAPLKAALAAALGLDGMLVARFDEALSRMSAADFVEDILVERLGIRHAVTGYDFHFGHRRQGTPDFLREAGRLHGFGVTIVAEHDDEGGAVSSTRIREALREGELAAANALLGWRWSVIGTVIPGDRRGRTLGYPTANMALDPACGLKHGIYAVRVSRRDGRLRDGVASFGQRPTFDNGRPLLETFLFDFEGDLYGETMLVALHAFLRPELRFDGVDALVSRMDEDAREARAALARSPDGPLDLGLFAAWPRALAEAQAAGWNGPGA